MLKTQLLAIRAQAQAIIAAVDAVLAALVATTAPADDGACRHPVESRVAAARMGRPSGWVCGACGAEGDH